MNLFVYWVLAEGESGISITDTALNKGMTSVRAVVIGGSIAGLLSARVLADYFEQVIVIDKDKLPQTPQPRRGGYLNLSSLTFCLPRVTEF